MGEPEPPRQSMQSECRPHANVARSMCERRNAPRSFFSQFPAAGSLCQNRQMEEIPSPISAQGELNAGYIALESDRLSERVDHIETGTARPRVAGEDTDASLFPRHPPPVTRHPFLFAGDDHIESGL